MKPVADVVTRYLANEIMPAVAAASSGKGHIPNFDKLLDYASRLDAARDPAACALVLRNLLGRAACVNFDLPPPAFVPNSQPTPPLVPNAGAVKFPEDHHFHLGMGTEWYWLACTLDVRQKNDGRTGKLSVLAVLEKERVVSPSASEAASWTAEESTIGTCIASATVAIAGETPYYYAAQRNQQWPATGGSLRFSRPGEGLQVEIGKDRIERPSVMFDHDDVLPLNLTLGSDPNLQTDLVFAANPSLIGLSQTWFLQGLPNTPDITNLVDVLAANGGVGLTPEPTPGIYYSWPQLSVSGTVRVRGIEYEVLSGEGWIDHQLMQQSLLNAWDLEATPPARNVDPIPFTGPASRYNGWIWQYFNLSNGGAFTGAGFFSGESIPSPILWPYGYLLAPSTSSGWTARPLIGEVTLSESKKFPTPPPAPDHDVTLWLKRVYFLVGETPVNVKGKAQPWFTDGRLDFNGSIGAEFPADFSGTLDTNSAAVSGKGYLESVGFEDTATYTAWALRFLEQQCS